MPLSPHELERPEGAEAADSFARAIAEQAADLGDVIDWDDGGCDLDTWRERSDADEMPVSAPKLHQSERGGAGVGGRPQFNSFPSTKSGPLLPVMSVVLPIRVGAGRPVEALQRRSRYYSHALNATGRWLWGHREEKLTRPLELHLITESPSGKKLNRLNRM
jgi:hypothetical protein